MTQNQSEKSLMSASDHTKKLISFLANAADAEQVRLQPLPSHAIADEEEHLRHHYALILAALLTAQAQVSETQSRLFVLMLDAMRLGDIRATLFDQARTLEPEALLEAARLIRAAQWEEELLVDALVLLRLDEPLNNDIAQVVGELAAFLGLESTKVKLRASHSAQILGLGDNGNDQLAKNWPKGIPYALTKEDLQKGLKGGMWYLDQDLAVNFHWQAEDAVLIFAPGVTLNTAAPDGATRLQGCHLQDAGLVFTGKGSLTLDHCDWQGDYAKPRIALESQGIKVTVTNSHFATRNANALTVKQAALTISASQFIACGDAQYAAGAIVHSDNTRDIQHCRFEECVGSHAGALLVANLNNVAHCEFIACRSTGSEDGSAVVQSLTSPSMGGLFGQVIADHSAARKEVSDLAVYAANRADASPALTTCVFRQCSLSIGSANYSYEQTTLVTNSQFHDGNLYFHTKERKNTVQSGCTFSGGQVIEKAL